MKKILTWILSIAMVLTMMPVMGAQAKQAKEPEKVMNRRKLLNLTKI